MKIQSDMSFTGKSVRISPRNRLNCLPDCHPPKMSWIGRILAHHPNEVRISPRNKLNCLPDCHPPKMSWLDKILAKFMGSDF